MNTTPTLSLMSESYTSTLTPQTSMAQARNITGSSLTKSLSMLSCKDRDIWLNWTKGAILVDIFPIMSDKLHHCHVRLQASRFPAALGYDHVYRVTVHRIPCNPPMSSFFVNIQDMKAPYGADNNLLKEVCVDQYSSPPQVISHTDSVLISFSLYIIMGLLEPSHSSFRVEFEMLPSDFYRPTLEINATAGTIQSPGWGNGNPYAINTLICQSVADQYPNNTFIMISVMDIKMEAPDRACKKDYIALFTDPGCVANRVWLACRHPFPSPTIVKVTQANFLFVSNYKFIPPSLGFKLVYTTYDALTVPQRLAGGKWNCSVPHWPDFQIHFPCNLHEDCVLGEDEEPCFYTTRQCGAGLITVNNKCFVYVQPSVRLTWYDAFDACLTEGVQLASLTSQDDLVSTLSVLELSDAEMVFVGLWSATSAVRHMYKKMWQWVDTTIAYHLDIEGPNVTPHCAALNTNKRRSHNMTVVPCDHQRKAHYMCQVDGLPVRSPQSSSVNSSLSVLSASLKQPSASTASMKQSSVSSTSPKQPPLPTSTKGPLISSTSQPLSLTSNQLPTSSYALEDLDLVLCPVGHKTHRFLACDLLVSCWSRDSDVTSCSAALTPLSPMMTCSKGTESVPFTLVCDHRDDCWDGTDESFCVFPLCDFTDHFECGNKQCIPRNMRCDGMGQCLDESDELGCASTTTSDKIDIKNPPPPAVVELDGRGNFAITPFSDHTASCPDTHFQCADHGYCLPVYVLCNGVFDCPAHEDESNCDHTHCPGFYRCRASSVCVHTDHLCDGKFQCPQRDDELLCQATCPHSCVCYGLAFFCSKPFLATDFKDLRFLEARGSGMLLGSVHGNTMLIHLGLADCGVQSVPQLTLPNLRILDLSDNSLTVLNSSDISSFPNLQSLQVSSNPLVSVFTGFQRKTFPSVLRLYLSQINMPFLDTHIFSKFPGLQELYLADCGINHISDAGFRHLSQLQKIDLSESPVSRFPRDIFQGLQHLQSIKTSNYKLCCKATLPKDFHIDKCKAPFDKVSSCEALLRLDVFRVCLYVFAFLALCGNLSSFVYRVFFTTASSKTGFSVFVTHLSVSDFCMGVYLAVVGTADLVYRGTYLWEDVTWKQSSACKLAGFLSLLSSEVSAFIICLVTMDRLVVIRFPFAKHLRFSSRSAHVSCGAVWGLGVLLATVPLLPWTSHWQFYGQTGICIPLPVSGTNFKGHSYSFGVMIALNFVIFMVIAVGQGLIYWAMKANMMALPDKSRQSQDLAVARRLATVVVSDFLCWFPIGLLGMLSFGGTSIPDDVNVAIAIFILPFNSALNPSLYTFNTLLEKRRLVKQTRLEQTLLEQMNAQSSGSMVDGKSEAVMCEASTQCSLTS